MFKILFSAIKKKRDKKKKRMFLVCLGISLKGSPKVGASRECHHGKIARHEYAQQLNPPNNNLAANTTLPPSVFQYHVVLHQTCMLCGD